MNNLPALPLLMELYDRGIELKVVGDRLRYRPIEAVPPEIRERMARDKPKLIALLGDEGAAVTRYGNDSTPSVVQCPLCSERDFARLRTGGAWRCARCAPYGVPGNAIAWWPRIDGPLVPLKEVLGGQLEGLGAALTRTCWCCGHVKFWRLRASGLWVCSRCHPSTCQSGAIDTITVGETGEKEMAPRGSHRHKTVESNAQL